mgnify:CR=1 FL=1
MDALEMTLLFDFYGTLLTEKQQCYFDLYYNQDLSLGEIASELGISRQGVHDNLNRTEALLRNMEAKTGCVSRDLKCRHVAEHIGALAEELAQHTDARVAAAAVEMASLLRELEE